jgi:hypothetical protein
MKMRKYLLVIFASLFTSVAYAGILDSLSVGLGGGYNNYNTFQGELYLKSDFRTFNRHSEIKVGLNNRSYQFTFDKLSELEASSVGLFGDFVIYPFDKGLFAGVRWEMLNFNWLSDASKDRVRSERDYEPTSLYTGTCLFF